MYPRPIQTAITLVTVFVNPVLIAQDGPGGVGSTDGSSSLELWIKTDQGLNCSVDSCSIESWNDQSGNTRNLSNSGEAILTQSGLNYNDIVQTSGLNRQFSSNSFTGQTIALVGRFPNSTKPSSGLLGFDGDVGIRGFNQIDHPGNSSDWTHSGSLRINGETKSGAVTDVADWQIISAVRASPYTGTFYLGGYQANAYYEDADFAEVIVYSDDQSAKLKQIESYLAIKYGITLNNSSGGLSGDYIDSSGNIIWDASEKANFHNDVIGIGRDDNSGLLQKQARSSDDSVRIYLATLASSNSTNSATGNSFGNDGAFVMIGHNGGQLKATSPSSADIPIQLAGFDASTLDRIWKVTNTNTNAVFNIDVELGQVPTDEIEAENLIYLLSFTEDFSRSFPFFNQATYRSGRITLTDVYVQPNSTRYIKIALVDIEWFLPVTLVDYSVTLNDENLVQVDWSTATELNNDYFEIERSKEGDDWTVLDRIEGAGTTSEIKTYQYIDNDPLSGMSFYRLKQVDFDGTETIYDAKAIDRTFGDLDLRVYPNPGTGQVTIEGSHVSNSILTLMDMSGRIFKKIMIGEIHNLTLNTSHLPNGFYFIHLDKPGTSIWEKLIISGN